MWQFVKRLTSGFGRAVQRSTTTHPYVAETNLATTGGSHVTAGGVPEIQPSAVDPSVVVPPMPLSGIFSDVQFDQATPLAFQVRVERDGVVTEEDVRQLAKRFWEEAGRPHDRDGEFWDAAEAQLGRHANP